MKTSFKRITALALTAGMAASLCACGGKPSTPKAEPGVANTNTDQTNFEIVGGISALIGAKILGPRIGKFTKDKNGKITGVNAFPGHNLPLGCLGVFILWLGWYGFNGVHAEDRKSVV